MDFDLYSLGSRLFEHMIQSLLTRVLGPEIVQYGDGPDGGRETVFDGEYKLGGRTLKGYGVVQVKHRLRRGSAADENNWAHVQLRRELDAFQDPRRKRRTPLNYIYVVNVHLSSTAGTGGRDRIESLFKDAQKRGRGFRNYIVWDATDVSRLLEANAEVRRTYAPFLLTSGLLSDVIDTAVLHAGGQAAHDAILTFLEKELLADQSGTFDPRGGDGRSMPPITVGFMDLPAKADVASFSWPVGRGVVRTVIDLSTPLNQPSTNANTFRQAGNTRILLVGGPGQGKSTISKFIAQIHRLAILSVSEVMTPEAHRVALQLGEAMSDQKISLPANRRFPVRIELKAFAQWLSSRQSGSVLQYVAERITSLSGALFERQSVAEWLKAYPWLVILDGLDEVPGTANRDALLQALSEFWVDITRSRANIVTLITTRPQGYHGEVDVNIRLDLEQLEPSVAVKYGRHLIEARFGADRDRVEELCTRLERASENSATARLMTTPLQTAIMSVLVEEVGVPPKQRWRLFKLYFDAIYKRERNRNLATSELLADHENVIVKLHRAVGLGLQVMSVKRGGPDCTIDLHTLSGIIKCLLEDEGYEGEPLTTLTQEILACATDRLVFLVGHTGDTLGFELRSLQEFMAAEALSDDDDEKVQTRLEAIAT
ncbi:MAG TPA: hypothetical protein VFN61_08765, partial [Acidimicrobiales bacterium]|nr:hypothetical protein [Acidimicrobiales bacterium]